MSETSKSETLLDLAQPRVVVLTDRGHQYTLRCRRITDKDWAAYFSGIVVSSQQEGRERVNVRDFDSARIGLAEGVLESAEGYEVAGDVALMSLPNWQSRVPLAHRLKLSDVLASARPAASGEMTIQPEGEQAELDATWGANADGKMQHFTGLKHFFATPTEEQHRRYMRESNRSFVQGGSRSGKTIYRGAQALLAKLYDELVQSVEGYAWEGLELVDPREIVAAMDMHHKVMAAQELFQPQDLSTIEEDAETE